MEPEAQEEGEGEGGGEEAGDGGAASEAAPAAGSDGESAPEVALASAGGEAEEGEADAGASDEEGEGAESEEEGEGAESEEEGEGAESGEEEQSEDESDEVDEGNEGDESETGLQGEEAEQNSVSEDGEAGEQSTGSLDDAASAGGPTVGTKYEIAWYVNTNEFEIKKEVTLPGIDLTGEMSAKPTMALKGSAEVTSEGAEETDGPSIGLKLAGMKRDEARGDWSGLETPSVKGWNVELFGRAVSNEESGLELFTVECDLGDGLQASLGVTLASVDREHGTVELLGSSVELDWKAFELEADLLPHFKLAVEVSLGLEVKFVPEPASLARLGVRVGRAAAEAIRAAAAILDSPAGAAISSAAAVLIPLAMVAASAYALFRLEADLADLDRMTNGAKQTIDNAVAEFAGGVRAGLLKASGSDGTELAAHGYQLGVSMWVQGSSTFYTDPAVVDWISSIKSDPDYGDGDLTDDDGMVVDDDWISGKLQQRYAASWSDDDRATTVANQKAEEARPTIRDSLFVAFCERHDGDSNFILAAFRNFYPAGSQLSPRVQQIADRYGLLAGQPSG